MALSNDLAAATNYGRFQMLAELALHPRIVGESIDMEHTSGFDDLLSAMSGLASQGDARLRPFDRELDDVETRLRKHFEERTTNLVMNRLAVLVHGQS